jgi:hypothetical protein
VTGRNPGEGHTRPNFRAAAGIIPTEGHARPVDIRRRIDRLVARVDRRDDYGRLLADGQVIHEVEDVQDLEAWRAEIGRHARADKIKVRTGFNEGIVWAMLVRVGRPDALVGACRYRELLARTVPLAVELGHEPILAVRDGDELVCSVVAALRSATATPPRTLWAAVCSRTSARTRSLPSSPP